MNIDSSAGTPTLIHHNLEGDPFARIPKTLLDDSRLSWKAKGLLSYLLGKPNHWKLRTSDLVNKSKDGEDSVRAGLLELREAGYVRLVCRRNSQGRVETWEWYISDKPILGDPERENPYLALPCLDKPHLSKNEEESKNEFIVSSSSLSTTTNVVSERERDLCLVSESTSQSDLVNEKSVRSLPPECQEIVDKWNAIICLPRIHTLAGRLGPIRAALRDPYFRTHWRDALIKIPQSKFLMGERSFRATFDWFIQPKNVEKIISGTYDGKPAKKEKDWTRDKI